MKRTIALSAAALLISMVGFVSGPASAKEVPFHTPDQLKAKCDAAGGMYGPPSAQGVYSCLGKGGNVVACGEVGKYAKTCDNGSIDRIVQPKAAIGANRAKMGTKAMQ